MTIVSLLTIKERILQGGSITQEEALQLLNFPDKEALYTLADEVRQHFVGTKMDLCSIVNAKSGKCTEDCKWCAQSAHFETGVDTYDVVEKEVAVGIAQRNASQGIDRYSLVTSGRAISDRRLNQLLDVYKEIRNTADIHLCASMGLVNKGQLEKLKDAGITHYHCNLETAPSFFSQVCTTHTIDEKIDTIKAAKELGIGICSGGIIGMGETMEQRIEMAFALQALDVQSIPVNILNPIEGTPLSGQAELSDEEILTTFALFRLINPKAQIRFAGGRTQIAHIQRKALRSGVSAALVGDYLTTIGTNVKQDRQMFAEMGFTLNTEKAPKQQESSCCGFGCCD